MSNTEATTRREFIDHQLARAGWDVNDPSQVELELVLKYPPEGVRKIKEQAQYLSTEYVDYALLDSAGLPLAVVEAKRESRDALAGKRQAEDYVQHIQTVHERTPFIFLTNGQEIWFHDWGFAPPRRVSGFFTRYDLERLIFQRQYRQSISDKAPKSFIIDRPYQIEAIKRVTEALEQGKRDFLLVMATGTGKTRTVIALIDLLMRSQWIHNVLFLADRRELVSQALADFKEHMPDETRARIESGIVDEAARIHVATYPSMMKVYERLSPGYYDLIIADESHRSIYNRYKLLFDHFDALQLGLTATPTDYIDHNTFELFDCPDGLPTFNYAYETAVEEEYLAQYRVLEAQTTFQIEGIRAGQLPVEVHRQLEEQGIELSEIDFEGSDLERRVVDVGTTHAMVQEIMGKCRKDASGTLPAKTIIFAMSHAHAVRIWESFNHLYPDLQRRGMTEIIDSHMERAEEILSDFKRNDMPRIAISVDMLDTGIDVPSIQNLVFAKPVFSQVKFWQMIGRGTRRWTDPQTGVLKEDFLIIDFWNNFAYFNLNPEGEVASPTEPLPVRLFRLRLEKLAHLQGQGASQHAAHTIMQLQTMLANVPRDNVNVRTHLDEMDSLQSEASWAEIDLAQAEYLSKQIAPLVRFIIDINLQVMTFEVRTERLAIAHLAGQSEEVEQLREQILEDLALLPQTLLAVQAEAEKLAWVRSPGFWEHLDYLRIMDLQETFAPLMRYRQRRAPEMVEINLPDEIARRRWIIYGPSGEGAFANTYRKQVETAIRTLANEHPTIQKLRRNEEIREHDVYALAEALNRPDLYINEQVLRAVYQQPEASLLDFVRHVLGLSRVPSREEQIRTAFDHFIADHPRYNATQLRFLRALRTVMMHQTRLNEADLLRHPLNREGDPHLLFAPQELAEIFTFANSFAA